MNPETIKVWLKRKKPSGLMQNGLLAAVALVAPGWFFQTG